MDTFQNFVRVLQSVTTNILNWPCDVSACERNSGAFEALNMKSETYFTIQVN